METHLASERLTPGITRRGEPLICGRLADEGGAIRGRVHAVVRRRLHRARPLSKTDSAYVIQMLIKHLHHQRMPTFLKLHR
jgi:hypothetical protein